MSSSAKAVIMVIAGWIIGFFTMLLVKDGRVSQALLTPLMVTYTPLVGIILIVAITNLVRGEGNDGRAPVENRRPLDS